MEHTVYVVGIGAAWFLWWELDYLVSHRRLAWAIDHYMCFYGDEYACRWHRWKMGREAE